MSWYYEPTKPIRTEEGIKARSQKGKFAKNWWANRWLAALEKLVDAGRLRRGKRYARNGQVLSIDETDTGIVAKVQGSRRTPYRVTIDIAHLDESQWERVFEVLSKQALFTAQLLAGEMPPTIEAAFAEADARLFPERKTELTTACTCPDYANPCKHTAAVHYILGERFDEDPFLLFRLRGRSRADVMAGLRGHHTDDTDTADIPPIQSIADNLTDFWTAHQSLEPLKVSLKPPATPLPVLKRLGQPTFIASNLEEKLGPVYHALTEQAITIAFDDDTEHSGTDTL